MEHILQFAVDVDDDGIKKRVEQNAEKRIMEQLLEDARKVVGIDRHGFGRLRSTSDFANMVVDRLIERDIDRIVEQVAKEIATRLCSRTKFTERVAQIIEESLTQEEVDKEIFGV